MKVCTDRLLAICLNILANARVEAGRANGLHMARAAKHICGDKIIINVRLAKGFKTM